MEIKFGIPAAWIRRLGPRPKIRKMVGVPEMGVKPVRTPKFWASKGVLFEALKEQVLRL